MNIIYRLSDNRFETKTPGINKSDCLNNFVNVFGKDNLTIIADNCKRPDLIKEFDCNVEETNLGSAGSFKFALDHALQYDDNDIIYLVEDDYIHKPGSKEILLEGLEFAEFVSLYDHSDKYIKNGPNPFIDGGEYSKVMLSKSTHWRTTNSTTMTFATKVKYLKQ